MKKTVYITRDTYQIGCDIWDAGIGIVKLEGCVQFESAAQYQKGFWNTFNYYVGRLGMLLQQVCERKYGSFPDCGEAWLVEDKGSYWLWTRVDHNMFLLESQTGKIIKDS